MWEDGVGGGVHLEVSEPGRDRERDKNGSLFSSSSCSLLMLLFMVLTEDDDV